MAQFHDPRAQVVLGLLDKHRLSFRWLAERINTSHVNVSRWLQGEGKPRDAQVFNDMVSVLREYEKAGTVASTFKVKPSGMREIPLWTGISAGTPMDYRGDVETLAIPDWGTDRQRWGRTIIGASMSPDLEPGDVVIFEDRPHEPGHVVQAFNKDGEDCVKVLRGHGESAKLQPANPEFDPIPAKGWQVKGVAVARIRYGPNGEKHTSEFPHGMRVRLA